MNNNLFAKINKKHYHSSISFIFLSPITVTSDKNAQQNITLRTERNLSLCLQCLTFYVCMILKKYLYLQKDSNYN